jgi:hypothetical protein
MFTTPVFEARTKVVDFCGWTLMKDGPATKLNEVIDRRERVSNILTSGSATGRPFLQGKQGRLLVEVNADDKTIHLVLHPIV